jgi:hypothetical protein
MQLSPIGKFSEAFKRVLGIADIDQEAIVGKSYAQVMKHGKAAVSQIMDIMHKMKVIIKLNGQTVQKDFTGFAKFVKD